MEVVAAVEGQRPRCELQANKQPPKHWARGSGEGQGGGRLRGGSTQGMGRASTTRGRGWHHGTSIPRGPRCPGAQGQPTHIGEDGLGHARGVAQLVPFGYPQGGHVEVGGESKLAHETGPGTRDPRPHMYGHRYTSQPHAARVCHRQDHMAQSYARAPTSQGTGGWREGGGLLAAPAADYIPANGCSLWAHGNICARARPRTYRVQGPRHWPKHLVNATNHFPCLCAHQASLVHRGRTLLRGTDRGRGMTKR